MTVPATVSDPTAHGEGVHPEENGPFESLVKIISEKIGAVLEGAVRESFLVAGTERAIGEDLAEIEEMAIPPEVKKLTANILNTLQTLNTRQNAKNTERLKLLQESMTISVNALRHLKQITTDKSVLEFEIKLLERFIITSEVVRDWREHVKNILVEINKVVQTWFLFTIFLVDDQDYELEVFWLASPPEDMRLRFEETIMEKIRSSPGFEHVHNVNIAHSISLPDTRADFLKGKVLALSTKSIFLDTPKIGGIVGIGVNFNSPQNEIRALVIESVLTTLLNVVGSIKAIYKYTKELEYYATRDPLTNLYNQRAFWELLEYEILRAQRHNYHFSVIIIDVDNFKIINDTYGHGFGDRFLREFSAVMHTSGRREDIIARYGGDEFAAILPDAGTEQSFAIAQRILANLKDFSITTPEGVQVKATVSIGLATYPVHASEGKDLFLIADNMLYRSKNHGKNRICIPDQDDVVEIFRQSGEKHVLVRKALEEKLVLPHFQPIVNATTGKIEAYEVLMRMNLPGKLMEAGEFIGIAETSGLISKLDYIIMEKAFAKVREHNFKGNLFVNISPKALILNEFIPTVRRLVQENHMDPNKIVFEITERDTVRNITLLEKFVLDLKFEGFKFAIDDFGSGFSSFSYLKRFPVDFLKVEGEFIKGMLGKEGNIDKAIVDSVSTLATGIGIKTVAESVESAEILNAIQMANLTYAQGYFIGRPAPDMLPE